MASVYVLLKGRTVSGRVTFHGVAISEASADAWMAGSANNWYHEHDTTAGDAISFVPVANPGE